MVKKNKTKHAQSLRTQTIVTSQQKDDVSVRTFHCSGYLADAAVHVRVAQESEQLQETAWRPLTIPDVVLFLSTSCSSLGCNCPDCLEHLHGHGGRCISALWVTVVRKQRRVDGVLSHDAAEMGRCASLTPSAPLDRTLELRHGCSSALSTEDVSKRF